MSNPQRIPRMQARRPLNAPPQANQVPMVPVSFAKQTKSLEERLYLRFRDLNPDAVRVTRFKSGTIKEEILFECLIIDKTQIIDGMNTIKLDKPVVTQDGWITSEIAESILAIQNRKITVRRDLMRAPARLGLTLVTESELQALSELDKLKLRMSQKEYNSFRAKEEEASQQAADSNATRADGKQAGSAPPTSQ